MKKLSSARCHGGTVSYYSHESVETNTPMRFTVFLPPQATERKTPYLLFLSGLTCTEDNVTVKAGAYKKAAESGVAFIAPDTSPRGADVPDDAGYDLGQGAGFYIDATQAPWDKHFRMESYLMQEFLPLIEREFPLDAARRYISGHSMGGHGALTLYLKYPDTFASCSAFAPIVAPSRVPWGKKAFSAYIGDDARMWKKHDACELITAAGSGAPILISQGTADPFLNEQLKPELLQAACDAAGRPLILRMHEGYDHSYFFIQSVMDEHIEWHMCKN